MNRLWVPLINWAGFGLIKEKKIANIEYALVSIFEYHQRFKDSASFTCLPRAGWKYPSNKKEKERKKRKLNQQQLQSIPSYTKSSNDINQTKPKCPNPSPPTSALTSHPPSTAQPPTHSSSPLDPARSPKRPYHNGSPKTVCTPNPTCASSDSFFRKSSSLLETPASRNPASRARRSASSTPSRKHWWIFGASCGFSKTQRRNMDWI